MSDSFAIPWTGAHQAPLSMEFSRQDYLSGLPFPSPVGSSWPRNCTQFGRWILYHWVSWKAQYYHYTYIKPLEVSPSVWIVCFDFFSSFCSRCYLVLEISIDISSRLEIVFSVFSSFLINLQRHFSLVFLFLVSNIYFKIFLFLLGFYLPSSIAYLSIYSVIFSCNR